MTKYEWTEMGKKMNCFEVSILVETSPTWTKRETEKDLLGPKLLWTEGRHKEFLMCRERSSEQEGKVEPTVNRNSVTERGHNREIGNVCQAGFQNVCGVITAVHLPFFLSSGYHTPVQR